MLESDHRPLSERRTWIDPQIETLEIAASETRLRLGGDLSRFSDDSRS